jgi:PTS system mannose-specific IIA component
MVGIVLVAHYRLADEFFQIMKMIVGQIDNFCPVHFDPEDSPEDSLKKIADAINKVETGSGVLILTDMFGGTPSNLSLSFLKEGKVEVLTGVNLPILIKIAHLRDKNMKLGELAKELKRCGQKNIALASEILQKQTK